MVSVFPASGVLKKTHSVESIEMVVCADGVSNGSAKASLVMIFKLAQSASKGWRKLRGHQHIPELIKGVRFIDGVSEQSADELKSSTTKSPTTHTEIVA